MTRILTTHVGSLPRSQRTTDHLFARERGEPCDPAAFAACMREECAETVRRQVEAGVDVVSDGETSKISYSTYVKDRYTGFSGDSERNAPEDLKRFPRYLERIAGKAGHRNSPAPAAPDRWRRRATRSSGPTSRTSRPEWRRTARNAAS